MYRSESAIPAALAMLFLLATSVRLAAAQPTTSDDVVSQEIEVHLAEIEVVVTDRQGDSVAGLVRENFELRQDGQTIELSHFRAITKGLSGASSDPATDAAPSATIPPRAGEPTGHLNLVIYIDRAYLELGDLKDVRLALKSFLRRTMRTGDQTMLVEAADALTVIQRFTTVPELVTTKLDEIRERPGGGRFAKEYQSILVDLRRTKSEGNDLDARDPRLLASGYFSQVQAFAAEIEGEVQRSTSHLKRLIRTIAGLPGRRTVLYIGGRMPAAYSQSLFEAWDEAFGRNSNLSVATDPGGVGGDQSTDTGDQLAQDNLAFNSLAAVSAGAQIDSHRLVEEVAELASSHGIVFHTLDAGSLRGSASTFSAAGEAVLGSRGASSRPGPALVPGSLADSLSSLRALAAGTGGRSFTGSRDFDTALVQIGNDLSVYYSLGFVPLETPKGTAKIEVRLRGERKRGEKLNLRYRPRLRIKDRDTLAAERTISALLLEEVENPLRVELETGEPTAAGKHDLKVPVSVTLPLSRLALVADGRVHTGRLTLFAASGGLDRVGAVVKAVVPIRIANQDLLTSLGRRVAYELELTVPTGQDRIAVTVRDDFRPETSTAVVSMFPSARRSNTGLPKDVPSPARGVE